MKKKKKWRDPVMLFLIFAAVIATLVMMFLLELSVFEIILNASGIVILLFIAIRNVNRLRKQKSEKEVV